MSSPAQNLQHEHSIDGLKIPTPNATQEKAVGSFLKSDEKSISLVQGPPGTGKTTLLCATICRWLVQPDFTQPLVVCAPTNKAVSVLVTRFLKAAETPMSTSPFWEARKKCLGLRNAHLCTGIVHMNGDTVSKRNSNH
jgi:superfamily II DNA or RNA helicase